jgi:hypothetical protein
MEPRLESFGGAPSSRAGGGLILAKWFPAAVTSTASFDPGQRVCTLTAGTDLGVGNSAPGLAGRVVLRPRLVTRPNSRDDIRMSGRPGARSALCRPRPIAMVCDRHFGEIPQQRYGTGRGFVKRCGRLFRKCIILIALARAENFDGEAIGNWGGIRTGRRSSRRCWLCRGR